MSADKALTAFLIFIFLYAAGIIVFVGAVIVRTAVGSCS